MRSDIGLPKKAYLFIVLVIAFSVCRANSGCVELPKNISLAPVSCEQQGVTATARYGSKGIATVGQEKGNDSINITVLSSTDLGLLLQRAGVSKDQKKYETTLVSIPDSDSTYSRKPVSKSYLDKAGFKHEGWLMYGEEIAYPPNPAADSGFSLVCVTALYIRSSPYYAVAQCSGFYPPDVKKFNSVLFIKGQRVGK